jgi:hypothetical protein
VSEIFPATPWSDIQSPEIQQQTDLILSSYERLLGKRLHDSCDAKSLYEADFIVLSHDGKEEPCFTYANKASQELWCISWNDFIGLPSKYSAEEGERQGRDKLLKGVQENGFAAGCTAIRVDSNGRRFFIENLAVWNLLDDVGNRIGQAATYQDWYYLD